MVRFLPATFDPGGVYQTYSQRELYQETVDLAGLNNSFVGRKVKVFARYDGVAGNWINRTRMSILPSDWGCHLAVCDSSERLLPHTGDSDAVLQSFSLATKNYTMAVYFPTREKYARFLATGNKLCTSFYPCYVWVAGTLKYADGDFKTLGIARKLRLVYIEADNVLLVEGHDNQVVEGAMVGADWGYRLGKMLGGFVSVFAP